MPKWSRPSEELPTSLYVGDRIIGIVNERNPKTLKMERRVLILESTETGWTSPDDTYSGYSINDCEYWTTERDFVRFAEVIG